MFSFFKKISNNVNNLDLAYDLFRTLTDGVCSSETNKKIIQRIQQELTDNGSQYPNREKILLRVIELANGSESSENMYIIAMAYSWSKAKYNDKAIEYLNKYLSNGICEKAISYEISKEFTDEQRSCLHLSNIYHELGDKYVVAYDYDNALTCFNKMLDYDAKANLPFGRQIPYLCLADVYRRLNKLDKAIDILKNAEFPKDSIHNYKTFAPMDFEADFYKPINRYLEDYKSKIEKGYKYKPRKKDN